MRKHPIGAEMIPGVGVHFRVWAPKWTQMSVLVSGAEDWVEDGAGGARMQMEAEANGYFSILAPDAAPGMLYKFIGGNGRAYPDPASRFQPQGPQGPSEIVDAAEYRWGDQGWGGVGEEDVILYELHIGTFTNEGTWRAARAHLQRLKELGVSVLEVMPVAEFAGRFGWGYDGVDLFAPTRLYGSPHDFRAFVEEAHQCGLAVILDVVYNHLGPDGNFLKEFSEDYFTDRYKNEWGEAVNFDGNNSAQVREFFLTNVEYWISEFHLDGLRLDATQQMFDSSPNHILSVIMRRAREAAGERKLYIVGENEPQNSQLIRSFEEGGTGLSALWNDDFHHTAVVALKGKREAYYVDYTGTPQEFISTAKYGFLYQGQWYSWQKKPRGKSTRGLPPRRFINYLENHDQVANTLTGERLSRLTGPGRYRAMTALLFLSPGVPLLFQGQEFAASAPFLYFADHQPELADLVVKGRKGFISQFPSVAQGLSEYQANLPHLEETFAACKLNYTELETHAEALALHKDLIELRRREKVLRTLEPGQLDGAVLSHEAFVLRYFDKAEGDRLLVVNFGVEVQLQVIPEPLLAPPEEFSWVIGWSSESPKYGGGGTAEFVEHHWKVPGQAAIWLCARPISLM